MYSFPVAPTAPLGYACYHAVATATDAGAQVSEWLGAELFSFTAAAESTAATAIGILICLQVSVSHQERYKTVQRATAVAPLPPRAYTRQCLLSKDFFLFRHVGK